MVSILILNCQLTVLFGLCKGSFSPPIWTILSPDGGGVHPEEREEGSIARDGAAQRGQRGAAWAGPAAGGCSVAIESYSNGSMEAPTLLVVYEVGVGGGDDEAAVAGLHVATAPGHHHAPPGPLHAGPHAAHLQGEESFSM